ncbi:ATP-grasp domain-containing protein [Actinomadura oligospora]|uniref:ATP-grasp domain-containing protein n=1 Tax=Actinomadura oligospora TaxID=111804 RepID=UPI0004B1CAA2|nr:ATP-grasp domain-containing protein [Actinomadura oligospora]
MDVRPHLALIATGMQAWREYLVESIAREYRIHLFAKAEPSWELAYVDGVTVVNTLEPDLAIAAARAVHDTDPFDGVLCWDEARIWPTACVAEALGLPGVSPEVVERCRDKHLSRTALAAAGVPQPASVAVASFEEARREADRIGYPVVVKPRALAASVAVIVVESADLLEDAYERVRGTTLPEVEEYEYGVLVEECLRGEELSIDSAVFGGKVVPLYLAHKRKGYEPFCEEIGHDLVADDPLLGDPALLKVIEDTHAALGFHTGMTHTEVFLTETGPRVVELNGRLGGDFIPYLGGRITGIDAGLAAAAVAVGRTPAVERTRTGAASVEFFYPEVATVFGALRVDESLLHPATDKVVPIAQPGELVERAEDGYMWARYAAALAIADTAGECREALDAAAKAITLEPAPPGTASVPAGPAMSGPPSEPTPMASWRPSAESAEAEAGAGADAAGSAG